MKRHTIIFFIACYIALASFCQAEPDLTIKIGTIAPLRSPWVKELKNLGAEWKKITHGKVSLKIYPGGIAGSEEDMARKMRMGILGGAVLSNVGIANIYSDYYILTIPFFIESEDELNYLMEKMSPRFEQEIEKKGFKLITWAKAGWIYFFSKNPVIYPEDLKKHKISFSTGAPAMEQAWKKSGYHIIPNELKDMMMALQSGMVNAFYLPPLMAASGQYFPFAPHMCSIKIIPLVGGMVLSQKVWEKVPEEYREEMIKIAQKTATRFYESTIELENEAIDEMKKHGLVIHQVPNDATAKWQEASEKSFDILIGKAFSKEIYDEAVRHITEFRAKQKK